MATERQIEDARQSVTEAAMLAAAAAIASFGAQAVVMGAPAEPFVDVERAIAEAKETIEARAEFFAAGMASSVLGAVGASSYESSQTGVNALAAISLAVGVLVARAVSKIEQIVTTEVAAAWNAGMRAAGNPIARQGPLKMVWDAMLDRRVCSRCSAADREVVAWGDTFLSGAKAPPAHARCRCVIRPWMDEWPSHLRYVDTPNERPFDLVV